jgi:hypothetical protein
MPDASLSLREQAAAMLVQAQAIEREQAAKAAPYIEVVAYIGRNGGFATKSIPLWLVRIVGKDGSKRRCSTTWHGDSEKERAMALADDWAAFLGVDIKRVNAPERVGGGPPD